MLERVAGVKRVKTWAYLQQEMRIALDLEKDRYAAVLDMLRNAFSAFVGAKIEMKELQQGLLVEAPIAIRILGENIEQRRHISPDVEKMLHEEEEAVNIHNLLSSARTDLQINVNRNKAGAPGG